MHIAMIRNETENEAECHQPLAVTGVNTLKSILSELSHKCTNETERHTERERLKLTNVPSVLSSSGTSQALSDAEELGISTIAVSISLSVSWQKRQISNMIFTKQYYIYVLHLPTSLNSSFSTSCKESVS